MIHLDPKKVADRIRAKLGKLPKSEEKAEKDMSPGSMALAALDAKDGAAFEEAIRRCYDTK